MEQRNITKQFQGLTKHEATIRADQVVEDALESGNAFAVAESLAIMELIRTTVRGDERFISLLKDELAKHHGSFVTPSGASIELCEVNIQYDYSQDGEWCKLAAEFEEAKLKLKNREELLKKIGVGKKYIDQETGEVLYGPLKSSDSTYKVTLKKY